MGGGALFYAIESRLRRAHLSDANAELMIAYKMVLEKCEALIEKLEYHKRLHSHRHYIAVRKRIKIDDPVERAARFIYLNKTCYNGLYRVNKSGVFNVPMEKYKNPSIVDADNLRAASESLAKAMLRWQSFEEIEPKAGDLVYCDPPYDETYDQYTPGRFNGAGQQLLADCANAWSKAGVLVVISNSDTPFIRNLYNAPHWKIHVASAANMINCKASGRGGRRETIITNA